MTASTDGSDRKTSPATTQLRSLTGMRFLAAAGVFFFHVAYLEVFASASHQSNYAAIFGQAGWSAVSFFFVLSGFVLTWSVRPNDTKGGFWLRRAAKLWPNHIVTFVAAAVILTQVAGRPVHLSDAIPNLFLVHSWIPRQSTLLSVNSVSWSLACEALFYLCFPLLIPAIRRIRPDRLWACALAVVAFIFLIAVVAHALPTEPAWDLAAGSLWRNWLVYLLPLSRLPEFVLGILLARIVLTGRRLPFSLGGSVALAIVAYALAPLFPATVSLVAVTVLPVGLVIAAAAAAEAGGQPSFLSSRPMVWLGEVSFAFYMCHFLVLRLGHNALVDGAALSTPLAICLIAVLFGVTLGIAWLMYVGVERPATRAVGSYLRRRRTGTSTGERATVPAADSPPGASDPEELGPVHPARSHRDG